MCELKCRERKWFYLVTCGCKSNELEKDEFCDVAVKR